MILQHFSVSNFNMMRSRFGKAFAPSFVAGVPVGVPVASLLLNQLRCASSKKGTPRKKSPSPKGKNDSSMPNIPPAIAQTHSLPFVGFNLPDFNSKLFDVRLTHQESDSNIDEKVVSVERATSSGSACALCQQTIESGSLRIGIRIDSVMGDFAVVRWNHPCCFPFLSKRYPSLVVCKEDIRGISQFHEPAEVATILKACCLDPTDKLPKNVTEAAKQLEAAANLASTLSTSDLTDISKDAGYQFGSYAPSRQALIGYVADALVFGAISPCKECGKGLLVCASYHYKCKGYLDSFTRCNAETLSVSRSPFSISNAGLKATLEQSGVCPGLRKASFRPLLSPPSPPIESRPQQPPCWSQVFEPFRVFLHSSALDLESLLLAGGLSPDNLFKESKWSLGKPGEGEARFRDIVVVRGSNHNVKVKDVVVLDACFIETCARLGYHPGYIAFEDSCFHCGSSKLLQKRSQRDRIKEKLSAQDVVGGAAQPTTTVNDTKKATDKVVFRVKGDVAIESDAIQFVSDEAMVFKSGSGSYHASLSKTDFVSGKNSFYILQLIHDPKPKTHGSPYVLFRKWGRVGDALRTGVKAEYFSSSVRAASQFEKIFAERSGYAWSQKECYEGKDPKPGHYTLLSIQTMSEMTSSLKAPSTDVCDTTPKLEPPTDALVRRLFDVNSINSSLVEMEIDVKKLPLGNITESVIQRGLKTLQAIQAVVDEQSASKLSKPKKGKRSVEKEACTSSPQKQLIMLNNQFYTYIPHAISKEEMRSNKLLLDSSEKIAEKVQLLSDLGQIAVTSKLLSQSHDSPVHTHYKMLKTEMKVVPSSDPRWKMVEQYMQDTHGPTHHFKAKLRNLWCIEREGEGKSYSACHKANPNRKLLWHGSRFTNWVGILSQGLRIAPPEAPATGYMFGKGIYFADMFSKSAQYATGFSGNGEGIMALAEVALGKSGVRYQSDYVTSLPASEMSIHAKGKYQPKGFKALENGVLLPNRWFNSDDPEIRSLLYNEYIVYTENQVHLRYLCQIDFSK